MLVTNHSVSVDDGFECARSAARCLVGQSILPQQALLDEPESYTALLRSALQAVGTAAAAAAAATLALPLLEQQQHKPSLHYIINQAACTAKMDPAMLPFCCNTRPVALQRLVGG